MIIKLNPNQQKYIQNVRNIFFCEEKLKALEALERKVEQSCRYLFLSTTTRCSWCRLDATNRPQLKNWLTLILGLGYPSLSLGRPFLNQLSFPQNWYRSTFWCYQ